MHMIHLDGKAEDCVEFRTSAERSARNQKARSQRHRPYPRDTIQARQSFQVSPKLAQ